MFGLSPTKILFTVAVIAVVFYVFKWIGRLQEAEKKKSVDKGRTTPDASRSESTAAPTEEMVKCAVCGDYVSSQRAVSCGRPDCPYPG